MDLTREQILEVPCITCDAKVGMPCLVDPGTQGVRRVMVGYHRERQKLRERYPTLGPLGDLSPTDKSLIVYYAFVMLADSCAANAEKLFGKAISSQDIQRTFGRKAVEELRSDGLLK